MMIELPQISMCSRMLEVGLINSTTGPFAFCICASMHAAQASIKTAAAAKSFPTKHAPTFSSAEDLTDRSYAVLPPLPTRRRPQQSGTSLAFISAQWAEGLGGAASGHPVNRIPQAWALRDHAGRGARVHDVAARRRGWAPAVAPHRHGRGFDIVPRRACGGACRARPWRGAVRSLHSILRRWHAAAALFGGQVSGLL